MRIGPSIPSIHLNRQPLPAPLKATLGVFQVSPQPQTELLPDDVHHKLPELLSRNWFDSVVSAKALKPGVTVGNRKQLAGLRSNSLTDELPRQSSVLLLTFNPDIRAVC
jgi:hypothetical protein